ncbi:MAG: FAD synthase [Candidatus Heimdallarchaeota archaeon]|nr:FAD synthase [Candidatus Heimdallarchaeota archaeon]
MYKKILSYIFIHNLANNKEVTYNELCKIFSTTCVDQLLPQLIENSFIKQEGTRLILTPKGREQLIVVLTGGVYDLLHRGHLTTLSESKNLGDVLIVVIARDTTVEKNKRKPIHNEVDRVYLINSIKCVDLAILGDLQDHMKVVKKIQPNIITLGSDQTHRINQLKKQLEEIDLSMIQLIRLEVDYEDMATTKVINEILNRNSS